MACEICGRSSCTRSFHSHEAQQAFDDKYDDIKRRMHGIVESKIERLFSEEIDGEIYVKLEDVKDIIDREILF